MKKDSIFANGFATPRSLLTVILCLSGVLLAMLSFAGTPASQKVVTKALPAHQSPRLPAAGPSPASGTLSVGTPMVTYTDPVGPAPNATGEGVGFSAPVCAVNGADCSTYTLTLDPSIFTASGGYDPTKANIVIQVAWSPSAFEYGSFVEDKNGNVIASNTAGLDPETITVAVSTANLQANGPYTIVTTMEIGSPGAGYTGTVSLQTSSGIAGGGGGPVPRYQVYESASGVATQSGEPSIGVDWNPNVASLKQVTAGNAAQGPTRLNTGGVTIYTANLDQYRVGFDDCASPALTTWTQIAFVPQTLVTLDAIGFVDHFSSSALGTTYPPPTTPGRSFHGQLTAGDSNTSYTDDDGMNHTPSQGGGVPQGPDHETIGGGPYNPNATIPPVHPTYANAIYYCTQNIAPEAECSRSDDGGLTFGPGVPIYTPTQCTGSIHGHVKVAPDGTVYVPNYSCTLATGNQGVAVSTDNGITWTENNVPGSGSPKPGLVDPSVAVGLNNVGIPNGQSTNTIYFGYIDSDGSPKVAVSPDRGAHWSTPQNVGGSFGIANSTFPVVVAGDDNRAAMGFLGTTTTGDSSLGGSSFQGIWHLYIASTYDGGATWSTIDVTPNDPIQVGPICNGGTTCPSNRNLLDFNGFDVDAQGRGLVGLSDGCINCTNVYSADQAGASSAAQGMIARQSGGKRLFAAFDPVEPAVPANPQAISAVEQETPPGVLVSWLEPDNGGSPITAYNIYRGTTSGGETFLAQVSNSPTNTHTKYLDTTALPTVNNYFYHVTAVNAVGESGYCEELTLSPPVMSGNSCAAPYLTVDGAGGAGNVPTDPTQGELTIQSVNIGEPFTSCTDNSLTFVMKVQTLDPTSTGNALPPANSEWQVLFNVTDTMGNAEKVYVEMDTFAPATPTNPEFTYGRRDPNTAGTGTFDTGQCTASLTSSCPAISGSYAADGTITIKLNVGTPLSFAAPGAGATGNAFVWNATQPGAKLTGVTGNTFLFVGEGAGLLETVQTTTGGSYTRIGNVSCANEPPVAKLTANTLSGNAPLAVNFDASGSTDPLSCATINSYTLDFGDGSTPVTQASPYFPHTYTAPGSYPAKLTVGDTQGQLSTNLAQLVITVNSTAAPQLTRVDSVMTHGAAGSLTINLPLSGTRGVECRSGGASGVYTVVFTFANPLVSVDQATVTNGMGMVTSGVIGSDTHQYIVSLTGVTNAQYLTVALVNAHDSTSAIGNVSATMGVLLGDTNGDGLVNSTDISQTKSLSGQAVNQSDCREDVNVDDAINSSDISRVKAQSGTGLPSSP